MIECWFSDDLCLLLQFSDKLENMLDNLTVTAEQVKHAEPISAHPDKLKEQLEEAKVTRGKGWEEGQGMGRGGRGGGKRGVGMICSQYSVCKVDGETVRKI